MYKKAKPKKLIRIVKRNVYKVKEMILTSLFNFIHSRSFINSRFSFIQFSFWITQNGKKWDVDDDEHDESKNELNSFFFSRFSSFQHTI